MKFSQAFEKGRVFTLPNLLSVSRVGMLPFFVLYAVEYREDPANLRLLLLLLGLVLAASLADFFDGFIARRWHQTSRLGRYLDPVCDKIVSLAALGLLTWQFGFPRWIFFFYLGREIFGIWGGTFLYFKRDIQGAPNWFGKIGVFLIAVSVIWFLCAPYLRTRLEGGSLWLYPEIAAYLLLAVLVAGVVQYVLTYYKIVFFPERTD